ncbi:MAG TPA: phospholipase D-like domain-containing protein [Thermomicrobiales bacterium]|nr:phospholipase D-like domain-containing protein [Thermomicrobiales bacterium]
MRIRVKHDGLSVHAIVGSEVVLFGLDVPEEMASRLLGFGFERTDATSGRCGPLTGLKTFAATEAPGHPQGTPVSTLEHPVQAFLWGDYAVDPGHPYTYRVVALGGTPENLQSLAETEVSITTESPGSGTHGIFFNRGAAASQSYAREFQNRPPDKVPDRRAWKWLSRGLEEALLGFIADARRGDQLRAAMYEFQYPAVLDAFHAASGRGVDVRIVMDAKANEKPDPGKEAAHGDPRDANLAAIAKAKLGAVTTRREANRSYIAHNKFIVLIRGGKPVSVWTGSTNVTDGGIFGHSNVGHIVRDADVAQAFLDYWTQLEADPTRAKLTPWTEQLAMPEGKPSSGVTTIFSPRKSIAALEWYASLMEGASTSVFFTAALAFPRSCKPSSPRMSISCGMGSSTTVKTRSSCSNATGTTSSWSGRRSRKRSVDGRPNG